LSAANLPRGLVRSALAGLRAARNEWRQFASVSGRGLLADLSPEFPVEGRYLVSSDRGVFEVSANRIRHLSKVPCFGLAREGGDIYLATWTTRDTLILRGGIRESATGLSIARLTEIFRAPTLTEAGRIHQIGVCGDALWICNTAANTLTKVDRRSGAFRANVAPFRCSFGHPITGDHNHVNSVFPQSRWLLFAAFKINRRGAFGLIGDGECRLWAHRNMGVHDCIIAGDELWFSDSYRFWDQTGGHGCVYRGREMFDPIHFEQTPNNFVRGIAGHGPERVFGNSFAGDRTSRFSGSGNLLLARGNRVTHRIDFPGAQVYDIIRADGRRFDELPARNDFRAVAELMDQVFGPPVETMPLKEVLVGPAAKKFDDSDIGDIAEYL
jgi:hypothetical protein